MITLQDIVSSITGQTAYRMTNRMAIRIAILFALCISALDPSHALAYWDENPNRANTILSEISPRVRVWLKNEVSSDIDRRISHARCSEFGETATTVLESAHPEPIVGAVLERNATSMVILDQTSNSTQSIAFSDIYRMDVAGTRNLAAAGATFGFVVGAFGGYAAAANDSKHNDYALSSVGYGVSVLLGGVLGSIVGVVVGSTIDVPTWSQVSTNPTLRAEVHPERLETQLSVGAKF